MEEKKSDNKDNVTVSITSKNDVTKDKKVKTESNVDSHMTMSSIRSKRFANLRHTKDKKGGFYDLKVAMKSPKEKLNDKTSRIRKTG